ncbi:hypothetical protein OQA88_8600 [Cercophora sp. LCS_1]
MELINKFIPPLVFTQTTKRVAFHWAAGGIAHSDRHVNPFRTAETGHFAIYADLTTGDGPLVIALTFEEKDLVVLGKQVFYHYFDSTDHFWLKDGHLEFHLQNYVTVPDDEAYKALIGVHVHFDSVELTNVIFKLLQQHRAKDPHFRVNELPNDIRDLVYYNLRASLVELPVPKKLGALGQWQGRYAAGTPQSMPYIESIYRNHRVAEWELRDKQMEKDRIAYLKATTAPIHAGHWDLYKSAEEYPWGISKSVSTVPSRRDSELQTAISVPLPQTTPAPERLTSVGKSPKIGIPAPLPSPPSSGSTANNKSERENVSPTNLLNRQPLSPLAIDTTPRPKPLNREVSPTNPVGAAKKLTTTITDGTFLVTDEKNAEIGTVNLDRGASMSFSPGFGAKKLSTLSLSKQLAALEGLSPSSRRLLSSQGAPSLSKMKYMRSLAEDLEVQQSDHDFVIAADNEEEDTD